MAQDLKEHVGASHHGLPITLGFTAAVMIVVGLTKFFSILRSTVMPSSIEGLNA